MNQINIITPYRKYGTWVFDDSSVGLVREPFVAGADVAIDKIVEHLGIKTDKIVMTFSKDDFPGSHVRLDYLVKDIEKEGDYYNIVDDNFNLELWLCPALLKYFDEPPKEIYIKIEEYKEEIS